MRKLGQVIGRSASGFLIVRSPDTPPLYSRVVDSKGEEIGKVSKILGPTRNPFILVEGTAAEGAELFV